MDTGKGTNDCGIDESYHRLMETSSFRAPTNAHLLDPETPCSMIDAEGTHLKSDGKTNCSAEALDGPSLRLTTLLALPLN